MSRTTLTVVVGAALCLSGGLAGRRFDLGEDAMFAVLLAVLFLTSLTDRETFWGTPWSRRR